MTTATVLPIVSAAACATLAVVVSLRSRRGWADWTFVGGMLLFAGWAVCNGRIPHQFTAADTIVWSQRALTALAFVPGVWLLFSFVYARGNSHEFLAKWRYLIATAFVLPIVLTFFLRDSLVADAKLSEDTTRWIAVLGWSGVASHVIILVTSVLVLMNLERTFRASVGTMRWRIKSMLLGMGVLFLSRLFTSSQAVLYRTMDPTFESLNAIAMLVATPLFFRSLIRGGQFDTFVYPSQAVLQSSVTVLLAGVYLLIVGLLAKVAAYFGRDATYFAIQAFVVLLSLVILGVLLQSDRVRLEMRHFISRHFQRPLYDYRAVWQKFTEGTVSRVDQADLCRSLAGMIADMFHALSVSIWVLNDKKDNFTLAASTSLTDTKVAEIGLLSNETHEVIHHFQSKPAPTDIESGDQPWAIALRRWQPSEFPNGGKRVAVPLIGRGEVLGLITVGDRVSGIPFSLQDFDMLKCVADHTTANLLNVQLSQKLLETKELEAFQTMAAFFVHDLKNAASTLNLMLRNMPVHFDDPAFRDDALRGMAKTVSHINNLISRLSLLRHELKIDLTDSDLNEVVTGATAELNKAAGITLEKDFGVLPKIPLDQEQMRKVFTNLVLNAAEATPAGGRIRIQTAHENDAVVVTVRDNGCGMSPEFISRSLFRPFQTTKKNGLGIGMFQSKMIVEAHGGRIAVASEPGKGTTFQIFLRTRAHSS